MKIMAIVDRHGLPLSVSEVAALVSCHADKLTNDGRQRLVRHGHLPEREIVTGIGPVECAARACATASALPAPRRLC